MTSPVDRNVLPALLATADPRSLARIYAAFERSCSTAIPDIETAFAARDAGAVGALAHRLKSSARVIGANALADRCEAIELACRSAVPALSDEQAGALVREAKLVRAWIAVWFDANDPSCQAGS